MPVKLVTFTTLFPDSTRPMHGIFVENRLRNLLSGGKVQARVIAPVPWFPFKGQVWGDYARFSRVPLREIRHGIEVAHPRYPLIPKLGMALAPWMMAAALKSQFIACHSKPANNFDLVDAHYFYPDGVAAVMLARRINKPVVITARGTDINLFPKYRIPRKLILWAAAQADAIIAVCEALKCRMVALGVDAAKITVLRNGVDLDQFHPSPNNPHLTDSSRIFSANIISVGALIPLKGHDLVIRALPQLPACNLSIIGSGPYRRHLEVLAKALNVQSRVDFLGSIPHQNLPEYYGAADALVLASEREGWANVLLESLACGTPVVATNVGGTAEIITSPEAGLLVSERTPEGIAAGLKQLFSAYPNRADTRRFAERFSWTATSAGQEKLFTCLMGRNHGSGSVA